MEGISDADVEIEEIKKIINQVDAKDLPIGNGYLEMDLAEIGEKSIGVTRDISSETEVIITNDKDSADGSKPKVFDEFKGTTQEKSTSEGTSIKKKMYVFRYKGNQEISENEVVFKQNDNSLDLERSPTTSNNFQSTVCSSKSNEMSGVEMKIEDMKNLINQVGRNVEAVSNESLENDMKAVMSSSINEINEKYSTDALINTSVKSEINIKKSKDLEVKNKSRLRNDQEDTENIVPEKTTKKKKLYIFRYGKKQELSKNETKPKAGEILKVKNEATGTTTTNTSNFHSDLCEANNVKSISDVERKIEEMRNLVNQAGLANKEHCDGNLDSELIKEKSVSDDTVISDVEAKIKEMKNLINQVDVNKQSDCKKVAETNLFGKTLLPETESQPLTEVCHSDTEIKEKCLVYKEKDSSNRKEVHVKDNDLEVKKKPKVVSEGEMHLGDNSNDTSPEGKSLKKKVYVFRYGGNVDLTKSEKDLCKMKEYPTNSLPKEAASTDAEIPPDSKVCDPIDTEVATSVEKEVDEMKNLINQVDINEVTKENVDTNAESIAKEASVSSVDSAQASVTVINEEMKKSVSQISGEANLEADIVEKIFSENEFQIIKSLYSNCKHADMCPNDVKEEALVESEVAVKKDANLNSDRLAKGIVYEKNVEKAIQHHDAEEKKSQKESVYGFRDEGNQDLSEIETETNEKKTCQVKKDVAELTSSTGDQNLEFCESKKVEASNVERKIEKQRDLTNEVLSDKVSYCAEDLDVGITKETEVSTSNSDSSDAESNVEEMRKQINQTVKSGQKLAEIHSGADCVIETLVSENETKEITGTISSSCKNEDMCFNIKEENLFECNAESKKTESQSDKSEAGNECEQCCEKEIQNGNVEEKKSQKKNIYSFPYRGNQNPPKNENEPTEVEKCRANFDVAELTESNTGSPVSDFCESEEVKEVSDVEVNIGKMRSLVNQVEINNETHKCADLSDVSLKETPAPIVTSEKISDIENKTEEMKNVIKQAYVNEENRIGGDSGTDYETENLIFTSDCANVNEVTFSNNGNPYLGSTVGSETNSRETEAADVEENIVSQIEREGNIENSTPNCSITDDEASKKHLDVHYKGTENQPNYGNASTGENDSKIFSPSTGETELINTPKNKYFSVKNNKSEKENILSLETSMMGESKYVDELDFFLNKNPIQSSNIKNNLESVLPFRNISLKETSSSTKKYGFAENIRSVSLNKPLNYDSKNLYDNAENNNFKWQGNETFGKWKSPFDYGSFDRDGRPIPKLRKKRSPSLAALNISSFATPGQMEFLSCDIVPPPRAKLIRRNMCVRSPEHIIKNPLLQGVEKLSYSVSDLNKLTVDDVDFLPFLDKENYKFSTKIDSEDSSSIHSAHDVHFSAPEISDVVVDSGVLSPHCTMRRATVDLVNSPLSENQRSQFVPRKTPHLKKKSYTFTEGDTYLQEIRNNVKIKKKTSSVTNLIRKTFSLKDVSHSDNPPCMPNLFKRYRERKKKKVKDKLPTISEEDTRNNMARSATVESFASIFLHDSDEESYIERCIGDFDTDYRYSINFPDPVEGMRRSSSSIDVSQHVNPSSNPIRPQRLQRSMSCLQRGPLQKRLFKNLTTEESSISLNPEALRKAQELLNKSLGLEKDEDGNLVPVPPKRTKSRASLNSLSQVNLSTDSLQNNPPRLSEKNKFGDKAKFFLPNENVSVETFSSIFSSTPKIGGNEVEETTTDGQEHVLPFVFHDDHHSVSEAEADPREKGNVPTSTDATPDISGSEIKLNDEKFSSMEHEGQNLGKLTHEIQEIKHLHEERHEFIMQYFLRKYSSDVEILTQHEKAGSQDLKHLASLYEKHLDDIVADDNEEIQSNVSDRITTSETMAVSGGSMSQNDVTFEQVSSNVEKDDGQQKESLEIKPVEQNLNEMDNELSLSKTNNKRVINNERCIELNFPHNKGISDEFQKFTVSSESFIKDCTAGTLSHRLQCLAKNYENEIMKTSEILAKEKAVVPNERFLDVIATQYSEEILKLCKESFEDSKEALDKEINEISRVYTEEILSACEMEQNYKNAIMPATVKPLEDLVHMSSDFDINKEAHIYTDEILNYYQKHCLNSALESHPDEVINKLAKTYDEEITSASSMISDSTFGKIPDNETTRVPIEKENPEELEDGIKIPLSVQEVIPKVEQRLKDVFKSSYLNMKTNSLGLIEFDKNVTEGTSFETPTQPPEEEIIVDEKEVDKTEDIFIKPAFKRPPLLKSVSFDSPVEKFIGVSTYISESDSFSERSSSESSNSCRFSLDTNEDEEIATLFPGEKEEENVTRTSDSFGIIPSIKTDNDETESENDEVFDYLSSSDPKNPLVLRTSIDHMHIANKRSSFQYDTLSLDLTPSPGEVFKKEYDKLKNGKVLPRTIEIEKSPILQKRHTIHHFPYIPKPPKTPNLINNEQEEANRPSSNFPTFNIRSESPQSSSENLAIESKAQPILSRQNNFEKADGNSSSRPCLTPQGSLESGDTKSKIYSGLSPQASFENSDRSHTRKIVRSPLTNRKFFISSVDSDFSFKSFNQFSFDESEIENNKLQQELAALKCSQKAGQENNVEDFVNSVGSKANSLSATDSSDITRKTEILGNGSTADTSELLKKDSTESSVFSDSSCSHECSSSPNIFHPESPGDSTNFIKEKCALNCKCSFHSETLDTSTVKILAVQEKTGKCRGSPEVLLRTWSQRQETQELFLTPSPVMIPKWIKTDQLGSPVLPNKGKDTSSPGPPSEHPTKDQKSHPSSEPLLPEDEATLKKDEDRTQKDRCIEVYPETIRQRQRTMAPSPSKVDIKNWEPTGTQTDENGRKFLPSVKALRNQFENGKTPSNALARSSSNSSSTNSLVMSSLEASSGFGSMTSSQVTLETSPLSSPHEPDDEPVEPIFNQFKSVDDELKEMMSKPPSTQGWNPTSLLKRLYYIPEAPKMHRRETPFTNIEGYLEKLPSGRKKATFWNAWKRRYFVAKDGVLYYYQNNQTEKPNMKLPLMGGKIEIMDPSTVSIDDGGRESKNAGMLGIDDGKGHYVVVRCSSRQEAERWKSALDSHTVEDFCSQYIQPWPRPTNPTLLRDTLIIDIGSCNVRAGVLASQPTLPQLFIPSVAATNRETKEQIFGMEALSPEVRSTSSISFPIRPSHKISKFSVDLNAVSSLLQKTFTDLKVDPKNYNIQLSVPRVLNPNTQAELLKILFDKFGVKSVNLTHQSILALYAYNATSGIVVDIGERMDVVPIIDGYIVDGGVSRVPYGGYRIMDHLRQFLFQKNISLANEVDSYVIRQVLETICYCAQHYNTEKQRCTMNPGNFEKSAPLAEHFPDSPQFEAFKDIPLDFGRFQATEGLFNPDAWGLDHPGLHKLVHKAIQECSMDIRKEMSRSIFLVGGVTQLPGLADRLTVELDNLTPPAIIPKIHASPYRYHASYLGACVLAESPAFAQSRITKEEWTKQGNSALRKWAV